MVNITHKSSTLRIAIATGIVKVSDQKTIDAIQNKLVPKGDVFEFSRAAGLFSCKKTYEVVPDCHPLPIEFTSIKHGINGLEIKITVEVHTVYKTGVEVEAMHGVMITALTMYDMLKPIDKHVEILNVQLEEKKGGKTDIKYAYPETLKVAVITCSDSIHHGIGEDKSGIIVVDHLEKHHLSVTNKKVIADDFITIQNEAKDLVNDGYQLIIFTGGTGLSSRDVTPDAISPLIEREVPGVMEAARNYGQQRTPYAMLSRGIAGFVGDSLIITLPGSPKGAEESMNAIFPYILHVFRVKEGVKH
jgi:molybdenum cofactor biosynthesis protein MoaC